MSRPKREKRLLIVSSQSARRSIIRELPQFKIRAYALISYYQFVILKRLLNVIMGSFIAGDLQYIGMKIITVVTVCFL